MATTVLVIPDISCEHCAKTVTDTLASVEGIKQVTVDISAKTANVEYDEDHVDIGRMSELLAGEEYPVASVEIN